jgi:hypothetical protein
VFSSKETGYELAVQIPAQLEINVEQGDDSLLFCRVKLMHSGENINHSSVTDEALVKAGKTMAYKPTLANFVEYTDAETGEVLKDFTTHDMTNDDAGNTTYIEKQVGSFTADEPYYEVEEETGHNFLYGFCAIPRQYTDAASIIERKKGTKISVELQIREMQYSNEKKVLELTDVIITGATFLGKNPRTLKDIGEGMKNARTDLIDFSVENNSIKFSKDDKIIELLEKLDNKLTNFNTNTQEGGNKVNKLKQLLAKYNKTVEDIDFDYDSMDDDALEKAFAEKFGNDTEIKKNMSRTFEISHDDIRHALYELLMPYEEADNDYYYIEEVYDTHFAYSSCYSGKVYGQKYTKENDNVAFEGERYTLHRLLVTDSEYAELQSMRENYSSLVSFKADVENKELHALRENVLTDAKYSVLAEKNEAGEYVNATYAELYKNMDNYSVEELEKEIKVALGEFALNGGKFSAIDDDKEKSKKNQNVMFFTNPNKKPKNGKYGNLKFN